MAADAMITVLSILLSFFRIQVQLCSLNVCMRKSVVIADLKPCEVPCLRKRICEKMSYQGLKASEVDETKVQTLGDRNHRELPRFKCHIFLCQAHLFQIDCPLKSSLFICSCQKHCGVQPLFIVCAGDLTPVHCSPFLWGMFTHARAHMCKRDGAFVTVLTIVLTVLSFSSELLHSICLKSLT